VTGELADASDSLDELKGDLVDHLADARCSFYRDAFPAQWAILDPEIVDPDMGPTEDGVEIAGTAPILGEDQAGHIDAIVERARQEIMLTAGVYADAPDARMAAYKSWVIRYGESIGLTMEASLSNAQVALYEAVGRLLIRKELR
jgi:hypothetical protein